MAKDLHDKAFDESTLAKLDIFEAYAQAWLPTFIMSKGVTEIHIFDFFAGTGYDKKGKPGSPIRILQKLQEQRGELFKQGVNVTLHLNEFKSSKFQMLQENCNAFLEEHKGLGDRVNILFYNEDFETLIDKLLLEIKRCPSLVFLDQNGVKFLQKKYLLEFAKMKQTDFLYFVSSSFVWRFKNQEEIKQYLDIDLNTEYKLIHRHLTDKIKEQLPDTTALRLYPFSLKKGANIYGIIFGATHPRAVDKFLNIAWDVNKINGDANFDIDDDRENSQLGLFEAPKLPKRESFKKEVRAQILSGNIKDNFELFEFCHKKGHIGGHAKECLQEMKKKGEITFEGKGPCVNYDKVHKEKKKVVYTITGTKAT